LDSSILAKSSNERLKPALASRLAVSFRDEVSDLQRFTTHFRGFCLPWIQSVEVRLNSITTFKPEWFPALSTLEIFHKANDFISYNIKGDIEVAVAILGGNMDNRLMQRSKQAWTKSYADINIQKWQQIVSDKRAFTIIDSVEIKFKTQALFNSVFGSMVSTEISQLRARP
jgi:hypothetical protein